MSVDVQLLILQPNTQAGTQSQALYVRFNGYKSKKKAENINNNTILNSNNEKNLFFEDGYCALMFSEDQRFSV